MIDKDKYTSHIIDEETRKIIIKNMSALESCIKTYSVKKTDFLDPYQTKLFQGILNSFDEIKYKTVGGPKGSERSIVQIYPYYLLDDDIEEAVSAIRIKVNSDFSRLTHRDVLGSLMSLGLVREKIGDIYIHSDIIYIIVDANIKAYVKMELARIKNIKVSPEIINLSDVKISSAQLKEKNLVFSSSRLDNIISQAYNLSREKSMNIVKQGKVKVSYRPTNKPSEKVEKNALISVKGKGRFIYYGDEKRETKKGNWNIRIAYYI